MQLVLASCNSVINMSAEGRCGDTRSGCMWLQDAGVEANLPSYCNVINVYVQKVDAEKAEQWFK